MNRFLVIFFTFITISSSAQNTLSKKLGQATINEIEKTNYKIDPFAKAVVLYEHVNVYSDEKEFWSINSDYYKRIKIFDKNNTDENSFSIKIYGEEKVNNIKAITYNLNENRTIRKTFLETKNIFRNKLSNKWTEITFTFPNLKNGSVIEYIYTIKSPYYSLDDWYFQSDIPKLHSEINVSILQKKKFRAKLTGNLKLMIDTFYIKKKCYESLQYKNIYCGNVHYAMKNVPAFKKEKFMSSSKNFLSKINIDITPNNYDIFSEDKKDKYKYIWKNLDKALKKYYLKNEINKKNFFKRKLNNQVNFKKGTLESAKKIYSFITNHFNWNHKNWNSGELNLKNAFKNRTGSANEINLSLYNSLKAFNIKCFPVLLSTRENGLPSEFYPVLKDFNYILVKVLIDKKSYFLDATNKFASFGELPIRVINGKARVLDFKKDSFWEIIPPIKGSKNIRAQIKLVNTVLKGEMAISKTGFMASEIREKLSSTKENAYLEEIENINSNIIIDEYKNFNLTNLEKTFREKYVIEIELDQLNDSIIKINPFFINKISSNPFKEKTRKHPIDFGSINEITYTLKLETPTNYQVIKIPENMGKELPKNGGFFTLRAQQKRNYVNIFFKINLKKGYFLKEDYVYFKEFYNQIIKAQEFNIELKKTN